MLFWSRERAAGRQGQEGRDGKRRRRCAHGSVLRLGEAGDDRHVLPDHAARLGEAHLRGAAGDFGIARPARRMGASEQKGAGACGLGEPPARVEQVRAGQARLLPTPRRGTLPACCAAPHPLRVVEALGRGEVLAQLINKRGLRWQGPGQVALQPVALEAGHRALGLGGLRGVRRELGPREPLAEGHDRLLVGPRVQVRVEEHETVVVRVRRVNVRAVDACGTGGGAGAQVWLWVTALAGGLGAGCAVPGARCR